MKYLYILTLLFLFSCSKKDNTHNYYYIETYEELSLLGDRTYIETSKPDTILAVTDSAAYMEAFRKFTISLKVNSDMLEAYGKVSKKPLSFQLFNELGNDITNTTFFEDKDRLEKEAVEYFLSQKNSIKASVDEIKQNR